MHTKDKTERDYRNYMKFPSVLKDKLMKGEIEFPEGVKYKYAPIKAYRGISREKDDDSAVTNDDFKSHAARGIKKSRGVRIDETKAEYYGVSLFTEKKCVENALKFPNPHKKIAEGYVVQECGPELTNVVTSHVCWWLYEDALVKEFSIISEGDCDE